MKVGQQVIAVSDPVNEGQMLSLRSKPSKMALVRAMNMRNYPEIEMEFEADVASVAAEIIDKAGGAFVSLHCVSMNCACNLSNIS